MSVPILGFSWTDPSILLFAGALVLIWFSISRMQRRWPGRKRGESAADEAFPAERLGDSASRSPPRSLSDWEVSMHETARELEGRLTSKMGLLEQLIREADRAANRLETALRAMEQLRGTQAAGVVLPLGTRPCEADDASRQNPATSARPLPSQTPAQAQLKEGAVTPEGGQSASSLHPPAQYPPAHNGSERSEFDENGDIGKSGKTCQEGETTLEATLGQRNERHGAGPGQQASFAPLDGGDPASSAAPRHRFHDVITLSDYGYPPGEISARTGIPIGEVELILSLRKARQFPEGGPTAAG